VASELRRRPGLWHDSAGSRWILCLRPLAPTRGVRMFEWLGGDVPELVTAALAHLLSPSPLPRQHRGHPRTEAARSVDTDDFTPPDTAPNLPTLPPRPRPWRLMRRHRHDEPDTARRRFQRTLRDGDRCALQHVRDFFEAVCDAEQPVRRGIDVGTGTNLIPALTMVPFCDRITLTDSDPDVVHWLKAETDWYGDAWDPYWNCLSRRRPYADVDKPRDAIRQKVAIKQSNLHRETRRTADLGTMFFVSESMSSGRQARDAITEFLGRTLRRGAPFALALARDPAAYLGLARREVEPLRQADVEALVQPLAETCEFIPVRSEAPAHEADYGLMLALGITRSRRR
jgi:hypothetical protein